MNPELLARISLDHRRRLAWFEDHKGEVTGMPAPLEDGLLLASKPKGIYKPRDLDYALSIRVNVGSRYDDGTPVPTPGGGWLLSYHQEGASRADRDRLSANRGLMQCIEDRVPVGVLQALGPARHRSQYQVLGLAMPVRWADGHFFLQSLDPPGDPGTDIIADTLEAAARAGLDEAAATDIRADDYDARLRVVRQIIARQGQSAFRAALLEAYQGRCAITGCDAAAVLEAAHLRPYRGPESNTVPNGLLLRSDVHTLFDLRLLVIDPATREVVVSKLLAGTQYESLSGRQLGAPAEDWLRPSQEVARRSWGEAGGTIRNPRISGSYESGQLMRHDLQVCRPGSTCS
jgi:putative restriction endonuclease